MIMSNRRKLVAVVAATNCLIFAHWVLAFPIPSLDVGRLTAQSDLVLTGTVTAISQGPSSTMGTVSPVPAHVMVADIQPHHLLKGVLPVDGVRYRFLVPDPPTNIGMGCESVAAHSYAVFFLKRGSIDFVAAGECHGYVRAARVEQLQGATITDQVAFAVAALLNDSNAREDLRVLALRDLQDIKGEVALGALRRTLRSERPVLRYRAAESLLVMNDFSAVPIAEDALLHAKDHPKEHLEWLRSAIASSLEDPRAIEPLGRLLDASEPETRRAAAEALRRTRSSRAVPALARALNDDDSVTQFWATMGLSEIVVGQSTHRPTAGRFSGTEKDELTTYWRGWARERGLIK